ncbi:MAG TPA: hypothetical protein V6D12_14110 [Candidatus Obscuribacterales bacterium]
MQTITPKQSQQLIGLTSDPVKLSQLLFGSTWWPKQEEIVKSVWANPRTAVKSCNSGGKSRIAAEIVLLYLLSFRPSRVITTAPTFVQVEEILWKEIASLYHQSKFPLGGQLNKTSLDLGVYQGKPWDAMGISTNEVNRFQGFKSPHLLVVLDEALGVAPEIWQAMEGLQPHRILAIGNPLDPNGDFYNCFHSPLWHKITIDGEECVRWQREHGKIPGLISHEWIEERGIEWGKKSPLYLARVRGEFPEETADTLISRAWVERARKGLDLDGKPLEDEDEEESVKIIACDVASKHGECETVIEYRYGHTLKEIKGHYRLATNETSDILAWKYSQTQANNLVVDSDGIGEGVADNLIAKRIGVTEFHGGYGAKAIDDNKFKNLRSQFYWIVAKKFEKGLYNLKHIPEREYELLKNQLCCIKVKAPDAMGRIQIETKEDLMARGIRSPDFADAFVYGEYGFWSARFNEIKEHRWR